jgi:hypothetical protein
MRVISVEPTSLNLESMKALGKTLSEEFAAAPIVGVLIFDDMRAASMYDRMIDSADLSLGAEKDRFYDRHHIASYNKNKYSGLDRLVIEIPGRKQVAISY